MFLNKKIVVGLVLLAILSNLFGFNSPSVYAAVKSSAEIAAAGNGWCSTHPNPSGICLTGYVNGYKGDVKCQQPDSIIKKACEDAYNEGAAERKRDQTPRSNTPVTTADNASQIFNKADASKKTVAETVCKNNDYNDTDPAKLTSCEIGYVLEATNNSINKCNDSVVRDKDACKKGFGFSKNGSPQSPDNAGAGGGKDSSDSDSCVTSDSGPLGWVICPVIDLASTFSQGVYTHFIQPFLEDVPVSTDSKDGAYIAWKSFRLIGNIVLVGTMLAVVYSQIRGDR